MTTAITSFVYPTDQEIKDACVESSTYLKRRLYIPTEFLLVLADQNAALCSRSDAVEKLVGFILTKHGFSTDAFYTTHPRPSGTLWEQNREFGIAELKAADEEELQETTTVEELMGALRKKLGIRTAAGKLALDYALECVALLDRKQLDYGPTNISSAGIPGVLVRMNDKLSRLMHLLKSGENPSNEATEDSWKDFTNYGLIGLMLHRDVWPTE